MKTVIFGMKEIKYLFLTFHPPLITVVDYFPITAPHPLRLFDIFFPRILRHI